MNARVNLIKLKSIKPRPFLTNDRHLTTVNVYWKKVKIWNVYIWCFLKSNRNLRAALFPQFVKNYLK